MEKTKFNLETLIKMPVGDPRFYLYPDGCGCAFGIGFTACHKVDWTPTKFFPPKVLAASSPDVLDWKLWLDKHDQVLFSIFSKAESDMLDDILRNWSSAEERLVSPDVVVRIKRELIQALAENGYVDVPEDADIGALICA